MSEYSHNAQNMLVAIATASALATWEQALLAEPETLLRLDRRQDELCQPLDLGPHAPMGQIHQPMQEAPGHRGVRQREVYSQSPLGDTLAASSALTDCLGDTRPQI